MLYNVLLVILGALQFSLTYQHNKSEKWRAQTQRASVTCLKSVSLKVMQLVCQTCAMLLNSTLSLKNKIKDRAWNFMFLNAGSNMVSVSSYQRMRKDRGRKEGRREGETRMCSEENLGENGTMMRTAQQKADPHSGPMRSHGLSHDEYFFSGP